MHLTDEQKAIGRENFNAAIGSEYTRRDFLREGNEKQVYSGNGLGSMYYGYGTVDKPVRVAVLGTGDEGNILIGAINPKYVKVVAIADIRPFNQYRAFHGDNSKPETKLLRVGLIDKYGYKDEEDARKTVRVYTDYKDLLDKEAANTDPETRIEAVIIGLPLHLHAPAAIAAMKAGFHVLTEKLMGHTVANCKEMGRAAKLYKKHLATGHQRHYNILYDNSVKLLQSGALGKIHYIRAQWHRNNQPGNDSWQPPLPGAIKKESDNVDNELAALKESRQKLIDSKDVPPDQKTKQLESFALRIAQKEAQLKDGILAAGGEYNGLKFKSAAEYGYKSEEFQIEGADKPYPRPAGEELIRWRLFDRTSAGLMAELGSHQLDAASIFIASMFGGVKQHPLNVTAVATRSIFPTHLAGVALDRDADDHVHCMYEYRDPDYDADDVLGKERRITVAYSSINGNGFGGHGETVLGELGSLQLDIEKEAMLFFRNEINTKSKIVKENDGTLQLKKLEEGDPLSAAIGFQGLYGLDGDISRGYCEEIEHWAWCIRVNPDADESDPLKVSKCSPEVALADAVIALTTNISSRRDETIEFREEWFDINSDETPERDYANTDEEKKFFTPTLDRYKEQ